MEMHQAAWLKAKVRVLGNIAARTKMRTCALHQHATHIRAGRYLQKNFAQL